MQPVEDKKNAFILDHSIINDSRTCFNMINDYLPSGDIFIDYDFVSVSQNNKLKTFIVTHGVKINSNIIEITNSTEFQKNTKNFKIIIKKYENNLQISEMNKLLKIYKELIENYNVVICTTSVDVKLECLIKDVKCEMYTNNTNKNIGMCTNKENPKINQFDYNNENKTLERFIENDWKLVVDKDIYGFKPTSFKQKAYLDLLLDDNISLVLCSGCAGTGKTFLACLTGIFKMLDESKYTNIVLSRATIDIGENSIGFLPGTKEEKMSHWIQPMKDNLDVILKKVKENDKNKNTINKDVCEIETFEYSTMLTLSKKQRKKEQKKIRKTTKLTYIDAIKKQNIDEYKVETFIKNEKIKIECISFFRGRTFVDTFCIIDEAQNLTMHEIKTIITRIGKGSKLIMIGDVEQSDLTKKNNDFYDTIVKMSNNDIVGVIQLDKSVRSDIASLAVSLL